jgi:hypothetical protein
MRKEPKEGVELGAGLGDLADLDVPELEGSRRRPPIFTKLSSNNTGNDKKVDLKGKYYGI